MKKIRTGETFILVGRRNDEAFTKERKVWIGEDADGWKIYPKL